MIDVGQHIFCGSWRRLRHLAESSRQLTCLRGKSFSLFSSDYLTVLNLGDFSCPLLEREKLFEGTARTCELHAELCRMTASRLKNRNFIFIFAHPTSPTSTLQLLQYRHSERVIGIEFDRVAIAS
jgi:hypothetical protein